MSDLCQSLFDKVGFCRDVSGEVGLILERVRRDRLLGRDMSGEVWFVSAHVRRGLLRVGK